METTSLGGFASACSLSCSAICAAELGIIQENERCWPWVHVVRRRIVIVRNAQALAAQWAICPTRKSARGRHNAYAIHPASIQSPHGGVAPTWDDCVPYIDMAHRASSPRKSQLDPTLPRCALGRQGLGVPSHYRCARSCATTWG